MKLSNEIDYDSAEQRSFVPEGWIQELADQIKETQHAVAEVAAIQARRTSLLLTQGPIFWKAFSYSVHRFGCEIIQVLKDDPSQSNFLSLSGAYNSIAATLTVTRTIFPAFEFIASPQFASAAVDMRFRKANPGPLVTGQPYMIIPCNFEITHSSLLVLHLYGRVFFRPEDAAKCIIEMLFSVEKEKDYSPWGKETKSAQAAKR